MIEQSNAIILDLKEIYKYDARGLYELRFFNLLKTQKDETVHQRVLEMHTDYVLLSNVVLGEIDKMETYFIKVKIN